MPLPWHFSSHWKEKSLSVPAGGTADPARWDRNLSSAADVVFNTVDHKWGGNRSYSDTTWYSVRSFMKFEGGLTSGSFSISLPRCNVKDKFRVGLIATNGETASGRDVQVGADNNSVAIHSDGSLWTDGEQLTTVHGTQTQIRRGGMFGGNNPQVVDVTFDFGESTITFRVNGKLTTISYAFKRAAYRVCLSWQAKDYVYAELKQCRVVPPGEEKRGPPVLSPAGWPGPACWNLLRNELVTVHQRLTAPQAAPSRLNILLLGKPRAGKSTFVNTVLTTQLPFSTTGRVVQLAYVQGGPGHVTTSVEQFFVQAQAQGQAQAQQARITLLDLWGLQAADATMLDDLLVGRIYPLPMAVNAVAARPQPGNANYVANPPGHQAMHAIIVVAEVDDVNKKDQVLAHAIDKARKTYKMKPVLVITKVDGKDDRLDNVHATTPLLYEARGMREMAANAKLHYGFERGEVFPCRQYADGQIFRDVNVECGAMHAFNAAVNEALRRAM